MTRLSADEYLRVLLDRSPKSSWVGHVWWHVENCVRAARRARVTITDCCVCGKTIEPRRHACAATRGLCISCDKDLSDSWDGWDRAKKNTWEEYKAKQLERKR